MGRRVRRELEYDRDQDEGGKILTGLTLTGPRASSDPSLHIVIITIIIGTTLQEIEVLSHPV